MMPFMISMRSRVSTDEETSAAILDETRTYSAQKITYRKAKVSATVEGRPVVSIPRGMETLSVCCILFIGMD